MIEEEQFWLLISLFFQLSCFFSFPATRMVGIMYIKTDTDLAAAAAYE
jgi:hypothetical protein